MRLAVMAVCMFGFQSVLARPAQIILLRHAEKPADESDVHLSERGRQRAHALAAFLTTNAVLTAQGQPAALFAPDPTRQRQSQRPAETLAPLAKQLKLPVLTPYPARAGAQLANEVLTNPAYEGKTVVICWVHDYLPTLARQLGANPPRWRASVYDRVWVIRLRGERVSLVDLPQQLLPGDAAK